MNLIDVKNTSAVIWKTELRILILSLKVLMKRAGGSDQKKRCNTILSVVKNVQ